ncbi:hypothetical protein QC763_606460 [Podospora pseudopauciseta]|uniref:HD domain-containing protein n=2 Tax=Podospora TaxID=5144 RepID=A0ABR0H564_9PEZI|nr:hypothetical protein QC763_606460 [Podospora pseudopauciseta]KAK4671506.1 hypothetical protein QC764_606460 [Podospora pseudoanserina]
MTTPTPSRDDLISLHGFTPLPVDQDAIFQGKPFLHQPTPVPLSSIPYPSSTDPLVAKVQEYAKEKLPIQTYNHSMRVFYWSTIIMQQQFPSLPPISPSTIALTCLLHDIGTTPSNQSSTLLSFEFQGGVIALDLLKELNGNKSQAEAVAEAIIRHQDLGTVGTITALGQILQLATVYDNMSLRPYLIHPDTKAEVNKAYPRKGWSGCFSAAIANEKKLKPWGHTSHLGWEVFENGVRENEFMREVDSWE